MARHASGVHILPSPSYLNGHPPATVDTMERLLSAMKDTFDFIVVDGGQSLDNPALKVIEMADQVLLITLLSLPCLHNTSKLLKSLASVGAAQKDRVRLVINRYLKKSDLSVKEAAESVQNEIFWTSPTTTGRPCPPSTGECPYAIYHPGGDYQKPGGPGRGPRRG